MSQQNSPAFDEQPLFQIEMEGSYSCQFCEEQVDKAVYLPNHAILTWMCTKGHKSFIEKFRI